MHRSIRILTWAVGAKAATPEMRAKDKASFMVGVGECWNGSGYSLFNTILWHEGVVSIRENNADIHNVAPVWCRRTNALGLLTEVRVVKDTCEDWSLPRAKNRG